MVRLLWETGRDQRCQMLTTSSSTKNLSSGLSASEEFSSGKALVGNRARPEMSDVDEQRAFFSGGNKCKKRQILGFSF